MITHLALIMDGNRRWARARGLPAFVGHKAGTEALQAIAGYCLKKEIKHLSLYTFSIENLKRTAEEKGYLFDLVAQFIRANLTRIVQEGIRVRFIGDRTLFPDSIQAICDELARETAELERLNVNVLFCYGGQQEIIAATKECMRRACEGTLSEDELTVESFAKMLWSGYSPAPEVVIRTGGVARLSNFLLFSSAYSELFFTNTLWPDFSEQELDEILGRYAHIKRNFGK